MGDGCFEALGGRVRRVGVERIGVPAPASEHHQVGLGDGSALGAEYLACLEVLEVPGRRPQRFTPDRSRGLVFLLWLVWLAHRWLPFVVLDDPAGRRATAMRGSPTSTDGSDDFRNTTWARTRACGRGGPGPSVVGGAEGIRTPDPLHAMEVRYQLRHSPATRRTCPGNSGNLSQRVWWMRIEGPAKPMIDRTRWGSDLDKLDHPVWLDHPVGQ